MVRFAYTGKITLTRRNILRVYLLAVILKCKRVQRWCLQFLTELWVQNFSQFGLHFLSKCTSLYCSISMKNVEIIWGIGLWINSQELQKTCLTFMSTNLDEVLCTSYFFFLEFDSFSTILSTSSKEGVKFEAICSWISHNDGRGRLQHTKELFSKIDFNQLSLDVIVQTIGLPEAVQVRWEYKR